jgi:hypothetical protein
MRSPAHLEDQVGEAAAGAASIRARMSQSAAAQPKRAHPGYAPSLFVRIELESRLVAFRPTAMDHRRGFERDAIRGNHASQHTSSSMKVVMRGVVCGSSQLPQVKWYSMTATGVSATDELPGGEACGAGPSVSRAQSANAAAAEEVRDSSARRVVKWDIGDSPVQGSGWLRVRGVQLVSTSSVTPHTESDIGQLRSASASRRSARR